MTRAKLARPYIKRIVMGPPDMFTRELLEGQVDDHKLRVWGVVVEHGTQIDIQMFLQQLAPAGAHWAPLTSSARQPYRAQLLDDQQFHQLWPRCPGMTLQNVRRSQDT